MAALNLNERVTEDEVGEANRCTIEDEIIEKADANVQVMVRGCMKPAYDERFQARDQRETAVKNILSEGTSRSELPAVRAVHEEQAKNITGVFTNHPDAPTLLQYKNGVRKIRNHCQAASVAVARVLADEQHKADKEENERRALKAEEEIDDHAKWARKVVKEASLKPTDDATSQIQLADQIDQNAVDVLQALLIYCLIFNIAKAERSRFIANVLHNTDWHVTLGDYNTWCYKQNPAMYACAAGKYAKLHAPRFPIHLAPANTTLHEKAKRINASIADGAVAGAPPIGGSSGGPLGAGYGRRVMFRTLASGPSGGTVDPSGGEWLLNVITQANGELAADITDFAARCETLAERLGNLEMYIADKFGTPGNDHYINGIAEALRKLAQKNKQVMRKSSTYVREAEQLRADLADEKRRNRMLQDELNMLRGRVQGGAETAAGGKQKAANNNGGGKQHQQQQQQQSGLASSATQPTQAFPDVVKQ